MSKRSCPNKNLPEWKTLVAKVGNREAFRDYMETNGEIRTPDVVLDKLAKRIQAKTGRDLDLLQETGKSLEKISNEKIKNLQSTVENQLIVEQDDDLITKGGQSYVYLNNKDLEKFNYLLEKNKEFPKEFKVTKKITKYERIPNSLDYNSYNEYIDFYYIKLNNNKKSNLYEIVNKETGEIIVKKVRLLHLSQDSKSKIAEQYGLEFKPTKVFSANRSIAFSLYRQKPSKAKYIAQAKKYLYDALKFLNPKESNLKINLDKIEDLLSSFPEEMWDYINTTYSPEDATNINASISLQNEIKFELPKLGLLQEIEKITGIKLQGVSFKNFDRSGSLAKIFKFSKLNGEWGNTITINNATMTTKELKASMSYYLKTKNIFKETSSEENVRKYAEHREINYNELQELVFGDLDKGLDNISYNTTGNSDTIELSKWRESIRNYDWQSVELFSKPYENFQNTVKERITEKFKDKELSNGISHLDYFFNSKGFNWLNINFNNISGQYYMSDMETEAGTGVETKMGGLINPFEMKIYQKPKAGENFLQEKEVFNRLAAILHEPFHALHALSYGTKEELDLRKAFDNLYNTNFGKEMMNQVFGSGYNKGQNISYDTLYKEFTAFATQLMLYPKQWINKTDLRSNDIADFILKIQTLQDKTYTEIVKTQGQIATTEKTITEEEQIKLSFLEKLYNYLVKALQKIIPLSKKFLQILPESKIVSKQVIEDLFGTIEEEVTKTLKLPESVKKSKEEFLQKMDELQVAINTLMQIDSNLFSSENITNFFTNNNFNQQSGRDLDFYMGDQALMDQEEGYEEEVTITPSETEQTKFDENRQTSLFGLDTQNQDKLEFHINTLNVIGQFLENIGIEQRLVSKFLSEDGNVVDGAIAAANFIQGTVDIIDDINKRPSAWNKLPEEAAHFWYRLLDTNSSLKDALLTSSLTDRKEKELRNSLYGETYKDSPKIIGKLALDNSGNVISKPALSAIREEAIGQLIAEAIKRIETDNASPADYSFFKKFLEWINKIIDIFKNTTQDPFEVAAMKILSSDMSDLMTWKEYSKLNNIINFADVLTNQSVAPIDYALISDIGYKTSGNYISETGKYGMEEYDPNEGDIFWFYVYPGERGLGNKHSPKFYTQGELDNWVSANIKQHDQRQKEILNEVRDNQAFFDRLLNKSFRKKSRFLTKTLRKYFNIFDSQNFNSLRKWDVSEQLNQITKKLSKQEKQQIVETNGYTNIASTLKVLPNLLQKYKKNPIVLSESVKIDGAKKQELSILNGIKEMIKLENPSIKTITAEEFVAETHNWLETNYLLGFANEQSYLSYNIDQTFLNVRDRVSDELNPLDNMTEEQIQTLPLVERQRIANIVGLTKQNPEVYHNKISLRFNDNYHVKHSHFKFSPSAWGNLTYFYTGKSKSKDAVLLHEIQNDNIEHLRGFKNNKVDLETSLDQYLQQLNSDLLSNIRQIENGNKNIQKYDIFSTNSPKQHIQLNYYLQQAIEMPFEPNLNDFQQFLNEKIELYKSDTSRSNNLEETQEDIEKAYTEKRRFIDFQRRGGIKSLLSKEDLEKLKNILHELNTNTIDAGAEFLEHENQYEPQDERIRDLKEKKQAFSRMAADIVLKINTKFKEMYGNDAPIITLNVAAKPLPKSQRRPQVINVGTRREMTIGNASQELNESINYLLVFSEQQINKNLSKNIEECKKIYYKARNANIAYKFNINLVKITQKQYDNLIENYKYNYDLLKKLIDEQIKKDYEVDNIDVSKLSDAEISKAISDTFTPSTINEAFNYYYKYKGIDLKMSTTLKEAVAEVRDMYNKDIQKNKQELKYDNFKKLALEKKIELEKNYGKIEDDVTNILEIEMNYFTPLVHHLIQKHINQYGKDFPMYFSGHAITKLTQGSDRTAMIYAGKEEVDIVDKNNSEGFEFNEKIYRKNIGGFDYLIQENGAQSRITQQEYEKAYQQATERKAKEIKYQVASQIGIIQTTIDSVGDLQKLSDKDLEEGIKKLNEFKKQSKQNLDRVVNTIMNISGNKPIETGAIYNAMTQISGIKLIWQNNIQGFKSNTSTSLTERDLIDDLRDGGITQEEFDQSLKNLNSGTGGYLVDLSNYNYNTPILYGLESNKPGGVKVNEPTPIAKYKKAVGLTRKEIHAHDLGFIKSAQSKYNKKYGSTYNVTFTQIGQSNYYTYTISGNKGSGVQTSIAFNREDTFSSPESILNNSTVSYSSFSQVPVTFSLESNENALGEKMLINLSERLSQNLGIAYVKNITPEEAVQLTSESKMPWNGETAFFIGNTVYFVGTNAKASTQLHEFSHPLVRAIKIANPKLFDKLYSDLKNTVEGKEIIAFIEKEYPEYIKDDSDFMEEAVVMSLTKAAVLVRQNYVGSSSFLKFIKDFLYQIKKYLRQVFGKIKVDKLDVNTSISELADMLHNEFFDIKEDIISEADIVSYNRVSENYRDELKVLTDKSPSDLQNIANEIFLLSNNHLNKIINDKNYSALEEVLKDALSRNEIEEMKKSIFDYQTVLLSKAIKVFDELKFRENQVGAIIQNLERMDSITRKIQNYMKILSAEVNTPDKVSQMYHYSIIMSENQAFIKQVNIVLDENDLRDSSLAVLTAKINSNIEASKVYNQRVYEAGVTDTLYEYVENLAETLELRHNEQIAYLTKSKAPQSLIDRENKRYALLKMDKEKFRAILNGQLEDAGALSQFFESYMGNPDPVIASFGLYVKKHVYDALYKMRDKTNDFIDDLVPLLETEGFGGTNPEKFYRQFVTLNKILKFEEDKEIPDQFEYSLLSSTVNWEYWYAQQSYTKKLLQSEVAETGDRTKYDEFMFNTDLYKKKYFNKQFSNEYYELDKIYENSPYGSKARELLSNLYTELNVINQDELNELDELEKSKNKEVVLRKIRQLSSLKYENGTLKQGDDLGIAKVIREYREASRPFISYVERDNAFQKALSRYEESLLIKYTADSSEYINLREAFILANTSVSYTEEYFEELSKIGKELDEVLSTIPSFKNKDAIKAAMNEISDALIGFKDEENQPIATDMSEDRIERVKKANILIETLRTEFSGLLGLTASEFARYNELFEIINNKTQLTNSEQDEFDILDSKKSSLTKVQKARLKRVYAKFAEIRTKEPTDYYLDIFNNFLQKVNTDSLNDEIDSRIINNLTADLVSDDLIISKLIDQNDEFKEWFLKNHYMKSFYSKEEERQVDKWIRVSVWSVNKPADDIFYNKTQLKDLNGNNVGEPINRVPSFKYKERVVNEIVEIKDEYDNIVKTINNITPKIVGETVDNRDRWLPLNIEQGAPRDSPFINNEYYALKGNSPEKFKILEILTKFHLLNQEDLDYKSKLYLTVPKFGKDLSEKIQSGKTYETPISKLQGFLNTVREVFVSTKDDFDRGLNYKKENEYQLMAADMFDSENTGIVIQGLSDIDYKAVSLDLSQSLIKYGNSAEKQKKLTEIWPITSALSKIVNNPKGRYDANKIVKQSYLNNNTVTPPNKKNKNNRAKAIDNFVDHQFKGVNLTGLFADNAFAIKSTSLLMKAASFGFFGLDVQSAIVNTSGMYIQSAILASGDRHLNELTLADGTVWAHATVMKQLTMGVYNKAQGKPIELQLFEIFDISEGRLAIKMSEPLSRTLGRDLMNLSFFYSPRKFGELANMSSMLGGFMKHKLIKQTINGVEKEIAYRDAWVLKDGKLTLAEGIDKEYDINGKKFINFRNLMQEKARTLGSVSSLNTPQMSRYLIGKVLSFLRSFLTPIITSRVGFMTKNKKWYIPEERYNLSTGEAEMGTYVRTLKELAAVFKYGGQNLRHMNKETKQAFFRTFFEIGVLMLLTYANQLLFGWDPEDPDRYKKMEKKSGSLPLPWIDNKKGGKFNLKGWLANQSVYLLLKIRTENEAFLPLPGFGLDDYSRLINIDAAAVFGSTIVTYTKIVNNLVQAAGDKKSAYYTRKVGPYDFQQKGSLKSLNFLAKSFGFSGKFVDPTMATKNFIGVLNKIGGGSGSGSDSNTKDDNESNKGTYLMR